MVAQCSGYAPILPQSKRMTWQRTKITFWCILAGWCHTSLWSMTHGFSFSVPALQTSGRVKRFSFMGAEPLNNPANSSSTWKPAVALNDECRKEEEDGEVLLGREVQVKVQEEKMGESKEREESTQKDKRCQNVLLCQHVAEASWAPPRLTLWNLTTGWGCASFCDWSIWAPYVFLYMFPVPLEIVVMNISNPPILLYLTKWVTWWGSGVLKHRKEGWGITSKVGVAVDGQVE